MEQRAAASATVLLVEDEPDLRWLYAASLQRSGFAVVVTRNGREALDAIRAGRVDVVLTDYMMPEMDGGELLEQLHALVPELPVIVMSSCPDLHYSTLREHGAWACCDKVLGPAAICGCVRRALGREPAPPLS